MPSAWAAARGRRAPPSGQGCGRGSPASPGTGVALRGRDRFGRAELSAAPGPDAAAPLDQDTPLDPPDPIDPADAYALDGWLQLRRVDLGRARSVVERLPELEVAVVGGLRSRVTIRPALMLLTVPAWERVHAALLSCAALATSGRIHVSCDTWDGFIQATDAVRTPPEPRRAAG